FRCAARAWSPADGNLRKPPGRPQAPRCPSSLGKRRLPAARPRCGLDHGSGQCTPDPDTKAQSPVPQTSPLINPGASAIFPSMITLPSSTALQQLVPPPPPLDASSWLLRSEERRVGEGGVEGVVAG